MVNGQLSMVKEKIREEGAFESGKPFAGILYGICTWRRGFRFGAIWADRAVTDRRRQSWLNKVSEDR